MNILNADPSLAELRESLQKIAHSYLLCLYGASAGDYEQLAHEDLKCELLDGELIVHSPATLRHERLVAFPIGLLIDHAGRTKAGEVFGSNAVMQIGQRRFCPDVSFLATASASRIRDDRVHGPMDLAVEVISPSTRDYDTSRKLSAYRDARVPEIWLIDPEQRRFTVHTLADDATGQSSSQALNTGRWSSTIVPGFTLDVAWLWRDPPPAMAECRVEQV